MTAILEQMTALAEETRSRILCLLDRHELSVGELCSVLQLPQSTVSRHLKVLADEGWVTGRSEGTSRQYRLAAGLDASAKRLWQLVRDQLRAQPEAELDLERAREVLARRPGRAQEFFAGAAGQWDALRSELFGRGAELAPLLGLLDDGWTVGDLGCGTGPLSAAVAPFVREVIAVDANRAMLQAARRRLDGLPNVTLRQGELEALPLPDGALDVAFAVLVLHYVPEPVRALAEMRRVLAPTGRLVVVDMRPHGRDEYRERMGHLWQGFAEEQIAGWLAEAGFAAPRWRSLAADPQAKGPALFVATARAAR